MGSDPLPWGYLSEFRERIEREIRILGCSTADVIEDLAIAGLNFRHNRKLDQRSLTVGHLKHELLELATIPASGMEDKLKDMGEFGLGAFFGDMPGAAMKLSIGSGGRRSGNRHARLLSDNDRLFEAVFKTMTRLGDNDVLPTGLVYRRRADTIADHVLSGASVDDLSRLIAGLAGIVHESLDSGDRKERRIGLIASRLLVAGSLGSGAIYSASATRFRQLASDEKVTFITEVALSCLEDVEAAGGPACALTQLILEEFLEYARPSERRPVLIALARIFPGAISGLARLLAERLMPQYRLEDRHKDKLADTKWSGRLDARRWHEAHAGWKLIDNVLEAVWPDAGKGLNPRQRDAVFDIVQKTIEFIGGDQSDWPQLVQRRRLVDGVWETDPVANVANVSVNREHVAVLASLRSAIHRLDIVLRILDHKALFELEPNCRTDPGVRKELKELRGSIAALQLWRRELVEKRRQGDYDRTKLTEPRATGARVALPRMPQVKAEELAEDEAAIRKVIAAARTLIPHGF